MKRISEVKDHKIHFKDTQFLHFFRGGLLHFAAKLTDLLCFLLFLSSFSKGGFHQMEMNFEKMKEFFFQEWNK